MPTGACARVHDKNRSHTGRPDECFPVATRNRSEGGGGGGGGGISRSREAPDLEISPRGLTRAYTGAPV